MARKGYTKAPCPGCHRDNHKERKKDEVCFDCLELIEQGKHFNEVYEDFKTRTYMIEACVPDNWSRPYYHVYKSRAGSDIYESISKKIVELAIAVSLPRPTNINSGYSYSYSYHFAEVLRRENRSRGKNKIFKKSSGDNQWQQDRVFEKKIYELISELDNLIREGVQAVEIGSIEYGKNCLVLLNNGEITLDEFNKK